MPSSLDFDTRSSAYAFEVSDPAGFQDPQQLRRQEVHLLKEMIVAFGVPEVVAARRVLAAGAGGPQVAKMQPTTKT